MDIQNLISLSNSRITDEKHEAIRKEKTAVAFEEIFARHLVRELSKDAFDMSDNSIGTAQSNALYKEFITEALAGELAKQQKLGMADMVLKYWDRKSAEGLPDNHDANKERAFITESVEK